MKTIKVKVYQYSELNEKAQEKARNWFLEGNDFQIEWENIQEDAKNVGVELTAWDYNRNIEGELLLDFSQVMANIIKEHGKDCETHKTAKAYQKKYNALTEEQDEEKEELEQEFLQSILEDYRIMADKQSDYIQSEEYIKEMMEANEYTFLEDGKRF